MTVAIPGDPQVMIKYESAQSTVVDWETLCEFARAFTSGSDETPFIAGLLYMSDNSFGVRGARLPDGQKPPVADTIPNAFGVWEGFGETSSADDAPTFFWESCSGTALEACRNGDNWFLTLSETRLAGSAYRRFFERQGVRFNEVWAQERPHPPDATLPTMPDAPL